MMKKILIILLLVSGFCSGQANPERVITGTIVEKNTGLPLPGVNVMVKDTHIGTLTDFDGHFSLNAKTGNVITAGYVGFKNYEVSVAGETKLDIQLEEDNTSLITMEIPKCYRTVRKTPIADIAVVTSADIEKQPVKKVVFRSPNEKPMPLLVLNGSPVSYDELENIDRQSIESVKIIKDTIVSSIFNSAQNGVIVITTKKIKPENSTGKQHRKAAKKRKK